MWTGKMYQLVSRCQSRVALCAIWAKPLFFTVQNAFAKCNQIPSHHGSAQVRERYYPTPPHPTPPLRDVTHLQRSMTYARTCKWTCRGVTSWERASTWTLLPHPTPPLRDVTHLQRRMTYVRTCKWTCRGVMRKYVNVIAPPHPTPRNIYKNA